MKNLILLSLLSCLPTLEAIQLAPPIKATINDKPLRIESPGYAAPCFADIDGDGKKELLVGQYKDGKIQIFPHLGGNKFASGKWLKADDKIIKIPGVW